MFRTVDLGTPTALLSSVGPNGCLGFVARRLRTDAARVTAGDDERPEALRPVVLSSTYAPDSPWDRCGGVRLQDHSARGGREEGPIDEG